jgi:carotenoid cleavage dioxygenase
MSVVDVPLNPDPAQQVPGEYLSELWIMEADNVEAGPIAKVKTGLALRSQVHGTWVSREKLDNSVLKG